MELNSINCSIDMALKNEYMTETSLLYWKNKCEHNQFDNQVHLFSQNDDLNNITGSFEIGVTAQTQPIGTNLIEFLNWDFDNFKDFFIYFTKYFGKYYNSMDYDNLYNLETSILYNDYNKLIEIAKRVHTEEKNNLKKIQEKLKTIIEYIYNLNNNDELEGLSIKQRFYVFQRLNDSYNISFEDLYFQNNYSFLYPADFNAGIKKVTENNLIKRIKEYDPNSTKLTFNNFFESSDIYTIFYIVLYNLTLIPDTYIKLCKNCHRYFITSKTNTVFCENVIAENKTCRDIGNQIAQKKKENEEYVYGKYRKIYAKKAMNAKRNADIQKYQDEYDEWKTKAKKFMKDIRDGKRTYEEFDKWLDNK